MASISIGKFLSLAVYFVLLFESGQSSTDNIFDDPEDPYRVDPKVELSNGEKFAFTMTEGECYTVVGAKTDETIDGFGSSLLNLTQGVDSTPMAQRFVNMLFVGNTGAGKSTLVQLLAGDNNKLVSKEISPESGDFIIDDGNQKISSLTVNSKTLYPDLVEDRETGVVLCDSPGFKDTRSPEHELVATYATKMIIERSEKIKIVLVVTHTSVQKGMYRSEFTGLLKHVLELVKDVDKYLDGIYLVATKVENSYKSTKRLSEGENLVLVSDDTIIRNVAQFLSETRSTLEATARDPTIKRNVDLLNNSIKLIDKLLTKNENEKYERINIFRKPDDAGHVNELEILQQGRNSLRNMLFDADNFVPVDEHDFGYTLSDGAKLYLSSLYESVDRYMNYATKIYSAFLIHFYNTKFPAGVDIDAQIAHAESVKATAKELSSELQRCVNIRQYVTVLEKFKFDNRIPLCQELLDKILTYHSYLEKIDYLTEDQVFAFRTWSEPLSFINKHLENELDSYVMFKSVFNVLKEYKIQKDKSSFNVGDVRVSGQRDEFRVTTDNLYRFLEKLGLRQYNDVNLDEDKIDVLNGMVQMMLASTTKTFCRNDKLIIIGPFVRLQELTWSALTGCRFANSIVILATHTVFIDADLNADIIQGRNMVIMAPVWVVNGKRHIGLDGSPPPPRPPRADNGQVGTDGSGGYPGGSFEGVGLVFEHAEDLTISANGGDGQDGQDGGHGRDGANGWDNDHDEYYNGGSKLYLLYNEGLTTKYSRGRRGSRGEDSGTGGFAGAGGVGGSITVHHLSGEKPPVTLVPISDGRPGRHGEAGVPGRGGFNGCDTATEYKTHYVLFIPVGKSSKQRDLGCNRYSSNGQVVYSPRKHRPGSPARRPAISSVCPLYKALMVFSYANQYSNGFTAKLLNAFEKAVETSFKCSSNNEYAIRI